MPPNTETGEIEVDLGLTPASTPLADTNDAPVTSGENDTPPSSDGKDTSTTDGPKSIADAIQQALAGPDDKKGEQPTDEDGKPKPDASADAAKTPDKSDPAAKTTDTDKSNPAEVTAEAEDDPSEDELKGYQPKVQKRIRKLLSQRNEFRREAETHREDASHYRNIRQFMSENGLQDGEVAELFEVGRLLKSNDVASYEKALDIVLPLAQQLLEWTGRSVPSDLREKVDSGDLTEDAARDLARARTRAATAERRAEAATRIVDTQSTQQQTVQLQTAVKSAVAAWEQQVRISDPDFGLKADAMRDAAVALVAARGTPKTPEDAVAYAKEAYQRVSTWFSKAQPKPQATRPQPSGGQNGNRSGLAPAPQSLADAIKGALSATTR